jgi:DNA invertase Pin-like site-specific DNA recombinase
MLTHVRDQDAIVVASMDRLARSVVDLDQLVGQLTGHGVSLPFVKEGLTFQSAGQADPLAVFQLQVMGAFAQLERALIRDRQREGIEAAKARGVSGTGHAGSAPSRWPPPRRRSTPAWRAPP